jgi:hypothetical protein
MENIPYNSLLMLYFSLKETYNQNVTPKEENKVKDKVVIGTDSNGVPEHIKF